MNFLIIRSLFARSTFCQWNHIQCPHREANLFAGNWADQSLATGTRKCHVKERQMKIWAKMSSFPPPVSDLKQKRKGNKERCKETWLLRLANTCLCLLTTVPALRNRRWRFLYTFQTVPSNVRCSNLEPVVSIDIFNWKLHSSFCISGFFHTRSGLWYFQFDRKVVLPSPIPLCSVFLYLPFSSLLFSLSR